MSGNRERASSKLFVWYAEDDDGGCTCRYVVVASNIDEAREKAKKGIRSSVCAACLDNYYIYDENDDDYISDLSWFNYFDNFSPRTFDMNAEGHFI